MAALADTNVLIYAYDPGSPGKQQVAKELLEAGIRSGELVLTHQALVEFVAATTRPRRVAAEPLRPPLLSLSEANREVEIYFEANREVEIYLEAFTVLYPDEGIVTTALRGAATYGLSWYDAHLWAYAEVYGLPEILTEDFEHGRRYGQVRTIDPFHGAGAADTVHESPARYG